MREDILNPGPRWLSLYGAFDCYLINGDYWNGNKKSDQYSYQTKSQWINMVSWWKFLHKAGHKSHTRGKQTRRASTSVRSGQIRLLEHQHDHDGTDSRSQKCLPKKTLYNQLHDAQHHTEMCCSTCWIVMMLHLPSNRETCSTDQWNTQLHSIQNTMWSHHEQKLKLHVSLCRLSFGKCSTQNSKNRVLLIIMIYSN